MIDENKSTTEGYAKQITSRLFGKPSEYTPHQDPISVMPVGTIVEKLCQLQDIEWAEYAFSREILAGKFDEIKRIELARAAIECGIRTAESCIKEFKTCDPAEIAKAKGMNVSYPNQPQNSSRVVFAEYIPPKEVNIYMDAVNRAIKLFEESGVKEALGELEIPKILLAHELYHIIEEEQIEEIWTKTYKIQLWRLGPISNHSRVLVLGEIAAMSFSKRLNALPYSPYVMDAFLVYGYSPEVASRLYKEMIAYSGDKV